MQTQNAKFANIQELAERLRSEQLTKRDMVIPSNLLSMEDGQLVIRNQAKNKELDKILYETGISTATKEGHLLALDPTDSCDQHLADKLGIPKKYYDRMKSGAVELLDKNVSHWLSSSDNSYFLRSFVDEAEGTGVARALLSSRYGVLDNYDVLFACLEAIKEAGLPKDFLRLEDSSITEKRLYLRFVSPKTEVHAPRLLQNYRVPKNPSRDGMTGVMSGFVITNSEIGFGSFTISPRVFILACKNGLVIKEDAFSKIHLGQKMQEYTQIKWSEMTKQKNYELIMSQVKDAIKTFISEEYIGNRIAKFEEVGNWELKNPADTIKNITAELSLSAEKENDILNYFVAGGLSTGFGVAQALTFYAHETDDADLQYELESVAVDVMSNIEKFDTPFVGKKKPASVLN